MRPDVSGTPSFAVSDDGVGERCQACRSHKGV